MSSPVSMSPQYPSESQDGSSDPGSPLSPLPGHYHCMEHIAYQDTLITYLEDQIRKLTHQVQDRQVEIQELIDIAQTAIQQRDQNRQKVVQVYAHLGQLVQSYDQMGQVLLGICQGASAAVIPPAAPPIVPLPAQFAPEDQVIETSDDDVENTD